MKTNLGRKGSRRGGNAIESDEIKKDARNMIAKGENMIKEERMKGRKGGCEDDGNSGRTGTERKQE